MANKKRVVEFFLYSGTIGLDVMGVLDVFSFATTVLALKGEVDQGYDIVFSGITPGEVRLNSGLGLTVDFPLGEGGAPDMFVLPGGMSTVELLNDAAVIDRLRAHSQKAKKVVTICRGVYLAAACGLLDGKTATMHWMDVAHFSAMFPNVMVDTDALYRKEGDIWTSAGITSGIDLALAIVEADFGAAIAMEIARILVLYRYRAGHQSQFSTTIQLQSKMGDRYAKLHGWIQARLSSKLTIDEMASFMSMSPRNFSRAFTKETGMTPGQYIELVRVSHARELLESSDAPISVVAHESGFVREERLRRAFVRQFGVTPSQYRVHFKSPR